MRMIDLTGKKFGRLTVIRQVESGSNGLRWECQCECGLTHIVAGCNLRSGEVKSCGCLSLKHGLRHTRLNRIWSGMIQRCSNEKSHAYKYYGAKGVFVCKEWREDFKIFYDWAMANGYIEGLTIDRINVNGDYEPANCRWTTCREQANNRNNNIIIEHLGRRKTIAEWEREFGFKPGVIGKRLRKGMSISEALKDEHYPSGKTRFVTYNGETKDLKEWAITLGIKYCTLVGRLTTRGWSVEKAFSRKAG